MLYAIYHQFSIYQQKNGALTATKAIIIFPTTPRDVSTTLLFARTHSLPLVVKGGGHATSGSSSSEGGLVIDLERMRTVTVDPAAKTVTAGGGALWSDIDKATMPHGLAAVGGTVRAITLPT